VRLRRSRTSTTPEPHRRPRLSFALAPQMRCFRFRWSSASTWWIQQRRQGRGGNRHSSERDSAKGYALASVNYRLSGQALFPAGVQDVKAAVRWLRAMPPNMDWTPIALRLGASRQELYGVMLGVTGDQPPSSMTTPWATPGVECGCGRGDWYGPVDLATMDSQQTAHPPAGCRAVGCSTHRRALPRDMARRRAEHARREHEALAGEPHLVSRDGQNLPFFIIAQGDDDCQVPWGQSQELSDALAKVATRPT